MRKILRIIDQISELAGNSVRWLCIFLVALLVFEVTMRFVFRNPTMWAFETSMIAGVVIYVFSWSYVHRHRGHIRVEILYAALPPRGQAMIDVIGHILFFFPLFIVFTYVSVGEAWESWVTNERLTLTQWYPPVAPLRTLVAIASLLLVLQGAATFIRDAYQLVRNKSYGN